MRTVRAPIIICALASLLMMATLAQLLPILQLGHLSDHASNVNESEALLLHDPKGHVHDDPVDELASHLCGQYALIQFIGGLIFAIAIIPLLLLRDQRLWEALLLRMPSRPLEPPSHPPKILTA